MKKYLHIFIIIKYLFLLSFLFLAPINLNADYLLSNKNICITDYWYQSEYFYYVKSSEPDTVYKTTRTDYQRYIYAGYDYNSSNDVCSAPKIVNDLSMFPADYNFLMALLGLLLGFSFLISVLFVFSRK